jgi:1,4-alpha-glucan branching enzyme
VIINNMEEVTVEVTVWHSDAYDVRLVGTLLCFGSEVSAPTCWDPERGTSLSRVASGGGKQTFRGAFPYGLGVSGLEFKLCCRRQPTLRGGGEGWQWMEGGNTAVPSRPSPGTPNVVRLTWFLDAMMLRGEAGLGVIADDLSLLPYKDVLQRRCATLTAALADIQGLGGLDSFSRGYEVYGLTRGEKGGAPGIFYREWAPGAREASLVGDFNGWSAAATPLQRDAFGTWWAFLPDAPDGLEAIPHDSHVRLSLLIQGSEERVNRLPAYIRYAVRDERLNQYVGKYWNPPAHQRHAWVHPRPTTSAADNYKTSAGLPNSVYTPIGSGGEGGSGSGGDGGGGSGGGAAGAPVDPAATGLRIYEAHVGLAGEEGKVSSYADFQRNVLPRVVGMGYNCLQLMAIMEHPYYGSFGYHVTSLLAPSSRFGTPEELKALVDAAHGAGLLVVMDCVHSHACKNTVDGLNALDGTDFQYFHAGARGWHSQWDSRLFDYSKTEVKRLLLSSLRVFVEEFRFDGFRFDGVTSMLYTHHGMGVGFSGSYGEYFGPTVDEDAVCYLQLANTLLHSMQPPCLTIAEDVSGMPTLGRPVTEGGLGFDFRLAMAVPDLWIKLLKEKQDEEWDIGNLLFTLLNRRHQEKCIAYSESHDQALVGDKTLAFWLMDKDMYTHMSKLGALMLFLAGPFPSPPPQPSTPHLPPLPLPLPLFPPPHPPAPPLLCSFPFLSARARRAPSPPSH